MEPHHRCVGLQTELSCHLSHCDPFDDDTTKYLRIVRLELSRLNQHARTVDRVILHRGQIKLIDRQKDVATFAELVEQHVSNDPCHPRIDAVEVSELLRTFESARRGVVKNVLRGREVVNTTQNKREHRGARFCERIANRRRLGKYLFRSRHAPSS